MYLILWNLRSNVVTMILLAYQERSHHGYYDHHSYVCVTTVLFHSKIYPQMQTLYDPPSFAGGNPWTYTREGLRASNEVQSWALRVVLFLQSEDSPPTGRVEGDQRFQTLRRTPCLQRFLFSLPVWCLSSHHYGFLSWRYETCSL